MSTHSRRVCAVTRDTRRRCPPEGWTFPGLGKGAGKTLDWKQDRTWIGDPLISGHSAPAGPASAAGHRVLQRSCALGLWQGTISRWVGPGLIVGLTPQLMLADDWQIASTKQPGVWDLAPAPVLWPMRGGLSQVTQAVYRRYPARRVWNRGRQTSRGALQPVQPCLVHQIAN